MLKIRLIPFPSWTALFGSSGSVTAIAMFWIVLLEFGTSVTWHQTLPFYRLSQCHFLLGFAENSSKPSALHGLPHNTCPWQSEGLVGTAVLPEVLDKTWGLLQDHGRWIAPWMLVRYKESYLSSDSSVSSEIGGNQSWYSSSEWMGMQLDINGGQMGPCTTCESRLCTE